MFICASVVELKVSDDQQEEPESCQTTGYELGEIISENGAATIYDATRHGLSTPLAYKSFQKNLSPQAKDLFEDTCAAAKALDHPNIAAVLEYGFADDTCPFIVSEKVEGTRLSAVLAVRGALNAVTTTAVFCQILDALDYATANNIDVGDMSPDRIFVTGLETDAPVVKIIGIGTTRNAFEKDASAKSLINDPLAASYASPERCLGKPTDGRSMVYSVGCMLYEVIFGKRAFDGTDQIKLLFDHVNGNNLSMPLVTRSGFGRFWKLVNKCLQTNPDQRFKDLTSLRHHLENIEEPIKNEREASPIQLAAMHISGARSPLGGELWVLSVMLLGVLMFASVVAGYSRGIEKLQFDIEQTTVMSMNKAPEEMIKKWKEFQTRGIALGQSRIFDADCDMSMASYLAMSANPSDAFEHFRHAAKIFRANRMVNDELNALNSAIGVYFYRNYDPFMVTGYNPASAHFEDLARLMSRRLTLATMYGRSEEWLLKSAYLDYADLYMMHNDWAMAYLILDNFHSNYPQFVDADVTSRLGISAEHSHNFAKAKYWYKETLPFYDTDPWRTNRVKDALKHLELRPV